MATGDGLKPSLRANGSRECAPDDRLREAIHPSVCRAMDCFVARAPRNDGGEDCDKFDTTGKSVSDFTKSCQALKSKIFRFTIRQIRIITSPVPCRSRGVSRSSLYVGHGMRWTRSVRRA